MKRVYIYMFTGLLAIILVIVSLVTFNPAVETWTSLFAGAAFGAFLVMLPSIAAYFKKNRRKSVK